MLTCYEAIWHDVDVGGTALLDSGTKASFFDQNSRLKALLGSRNQASNTYSKGLASIIRTWMNKVITQGHFIGVIVRVASYCR